MEDSGAAAELVIVFSCGAVISLVATTKYNTGCESEAVCYRFLRSGVW